MFRMLTLPPDLQGGWDVPILMWLGGVEAAVVATGFAAVSLLRKERRRHFALITGIPGILLVLGAGVYLIVSR